jgi:hypothetical protein
LLRDQGDYVVGPGRVALPDHLPSLVAAPAPEVIYEPGDLLVKATRENVRRNVES